MARRDLLLARLVLTVLVQGPMLSEAQPLFQKVYGAYGNEWTTGIAETTDSSLAVAAVTQSNVFPGNSSDICLMKYNLNGGVLWSKHFDGGFIGFPKALTATPDGGIVVCGHAEALNDGGVVFKVDASGTPVWGRWASGIPYFSSVAAAADGSVLVLGRTSFPDPNTAVQKLNSDGEVVWSSGFGTSYFDQPNDIAPTSDGGAIIAGSTLPDGIENDGLLMKIDASGGLQWSRTYSLASQCVDLTDVIECQAGGYLAAGKGCYPDTWPVLVRTDALGDTLWTRRLDAFGGEGCSVTEIPGGFIVSGGIGGTYGQIFFCEVDASGTMLWARGFDEQLGSNGKAIRMHGGTLALTATVMNAGQGLANILLATADSSGRGTHCDPDEFSIGFLPATWELAVLGGITPGIVSSYWLPVAGDWSAEIYQACEGDASVLESSGRRVRVGPNPTSGNLVLQGLEPGDVIAVRNALGQLICQWLNDGTGTWERELPSAAQGLLFLSISDERSMAVLTERIVRIH